MKNNVINLPLYQHYEHPEKAIGKDVRTSDGKTHYIARIHKLYGFVDNKLVVKEYYRPVLEVIK